MVVFDHVSIEVAGQVVISVGCGVGRRGDVAEDVMNSRGHVATEDRRDVIAASSAARTIVPRPRASTADTTDRMIRGASGGAAGAGRSTDLMPRRAMI